MPGGTFGMRGAGKRRRQSEPAFASCNAKAGAAAQFSRAALGRTLPSAHHLSCAAKVSVVPALAVTTQFSVSLETLPEPRRTLGRS